jgi:hypothetical protein
MFVCLHITELLSCLNARFAHLLHVQAASSGAVNLYPRERDLILHVGELILFLHSLHMEPLVTATRSLPS